MFPYTALDIVNVLHHELTPDDERRHGAHIARDCERDDDHPDDSPTTGTNAARFRFIGALGSAIVSIVSVSRSVKQAK